jgi:hypothetical protein
MILPQPSSAIVREEREIKIAIAARIFSNSLVALTGLI